MEAGGTQVVGHVGLHALGSFADRLGDRRDAVSERSAGRVRDVPVHDRGRVLTQTMLMLAGGGESCADIEALTDLKTGCSVRGVFRHHLVSHVCRHPYPRRGGAGPPRQWLESVARCGGVLRRSPAATIQVILDVDATLVEIHSENKDGAAGALQRRVRVPPFVLFR